MAATSNYPSHKGRTRTEVVFSKGEQTVTAIYTTWMRQDCHWKHTLVQTATKMLSHLGKTPTPSGVSDKLKNTDLFLKYV